MDDPQLRPDLCRRHLAVVAGHLDWEQIPLLETKYAGDFEALFVEVYRVVMWLAWVPNLIVAETIVQRRRARQPKRESKFVNAQVEASS